MLCRELRGFGFECDSKQFSKRDEPCKVNDSESI